MKTTSPILLTMISALGCACYSLIAHSENDTVPRRYNKEQYIQQLTPRRRGIQLITSTPVVNKQATTRSKSDPVTAPSVANTESQHKLTPVAISVNQSVSQTSPDKSWQAPQLNLELTFRFNSAELTDETKMNLDVLGQAMQDSKLKPFRFMIEGHTDSSGGATYNWELSLRRAASVRRYLIETQAIVSERLDVIGKGESELRFPDSPTAAGNRRVVIINAGVS